MTYCTSLLLTASLIFSVLVPALAKPPTVAQPATMAKSQNDLYRSIQATIRAKKYPEAVEQAQQALKTDGLLVSDKIRLINIAAEACMKLGAVHYPAAKEFLEQIITDPAADNSQKITALKDMSETYIESLDGQYLDQMDLAPAHTILEQALKLPDLKPEERAEALQNIANLYAREEKVSKAVETYQEVLKLNPSEEAAKSVWHAIAGAYVNVGLTDKAEAIYKKQNFDLVSLYVDLAEWEKATAYLTKIVENSSLDEKERWEAFKMLPCFVRTSDRDGLKGDIRYNATAFREAIKEIRSFSSKYLSDFLQVDPDRATILLKTFINTHVYNDSFYGRTLVNPNYLAWAAPFLLKAKLNEKDYPLVRVKFVNALAVLGNDKEVFSETASMLSDSRLSKETQFWAGLVNNAFSSPTTDLEKAVKAEKDLPVGDMAREILQAAKTVLAAGKDEDAQKLYALYEGLLPQEPRAEVKSIFVDQAPMSVEGWMASPLLKNKELTGKLDRPYGDNLKQLLETDAAASGRGIGASSTKIAGNTESNFHVAIDAQGIHMFFDLLDSQAQGVLDGLVKGGSVEMYFAPGEGRPYYTFIPRIPSGFAGSPTSRGYGPGSFITMYPNSGWRLPNPDEGTLQTDAQMTDRGFGLSLFLSWELFYDMLPANGTKWQFDAIRWTRAGGRSFGGSQSVHNPSSWGDIAFSGLTPENLTAIKRAIIFKAAAKYKDVKRLTNPVQRWNDPELGDPAFYQSEVAPLLASLDQYAAKINQGMTPAEVESLFEKAVPGWLEIEYRVSALRQEYLDDKFFERQ